MQKPPELLSPLICDNSEWAVVIERMLSIRGLVTIISITIYLIGRIEHLRGIIAICYSPPTHIAVKGGGDDDDEEHPDDIYPEDPANRSVVNSAMIFLILFVFWFTAKI